MANELAILGLTAASIGFIHTILGPDHYLPFIVMGRARGWTLRRTLSVTLGCGIGHVLGSVMLGAVGILFGWTVSGLERFEGNRGEVGGWMLIGFGLAYMAWGIRRSFRNRPHTHWHAHGDGTVHDHLHAHRGEHAHVHEARRREHPRAPLNLTPWALFLIFVLGPCEPLIPILMYPAAQHSWWGVALVTLIFGTTTLVTMMIATAFGFAGLSHVRFAWLERHTHALAGLAVVACGVAIRFGL